MARHRGPSAPPQVGTLVKHALMATDEEGFGLQPTGARQGPLEGANWRPADPGGPLAAAIGRSWGMAADAGTALPSCGLRAPIAVGSVMASPGSTPQRPAG